MAKSVKQKRLEGVIRKNISDIIQFGIKDPNVGFVTITDVNVSNDHSYAKVFVTFLGKDARAQAGLKALNRAKGFIRSELSQRLDIRRTPELIFVLDETEMKARHIDEIIHSLHTDDDSTETE
ncbi:MAG: 30S ribosome-binding factor RbfA [Bulleidia sp.]